MHAIRDDYVITSGDASAAYMGRFYSCERQSWASISATDPIAGPSPKRPYRLRFVDLRIYSTSMILRSGIRMLAYVLLNPEAPTMGAAILIDEVQSSSHVIHWAGDVPMGGGVLWRVHSPGLVATDIVKMVVGYE